MAARLSVQVAYQERKVNKNAQILLVFDHGNKMKQTHTETQCKGVSASLYASGPRLLVEARPVPML